MEVRAASIEMGLWKLSPWLKLPNDSSWAYRLEALFPQTPAPSSRGGRDIEGALLRLLGQNPRDTLYVVLSPGPSQLPADGKGALLSEQSPVFVDRLKASGYGPLQRRTFAVGGDRPRTLLLTVLAPKDLALPAPGQLPKSAAMALKPPTSAGLLKREGASRDGWVLPALLAGAVLAGLAAYLAGAKKRYGPPAPAAAQPPASEPAEAPAADMRKIQRALDMISQDLAESAQQISQSTRAIETHVADVGLLRQEILEREAQIEAWVELAMAYLESLNRLVNADGLPEDRKALVQKTAADFARLCSRNGLDVIMPAPGEPIVPGLHEIVDSREDGEIVAYCKHWGFKQGPKVLKKAVVVAAS